MRDWAALAVLGLVAIALRVWQIDRESLWLDEAGRVAIASLPLGQIAHGVAVVELSPPLYHYILALWMRISGDGDAAVRLLSALLALPAVVLAWSLGRAVAGRRAGLAAAGLAAVSPFAVHYGQEAAMYALLLPLGLGTIRAAVGAMGGEATTSAGRAARSRGLVAYVVLGTLALYTHYYAALLLVTVAVVGVVHSLERRSRHGVVIWLAVHAIIALAFLPWLPTLVSQAGLAASVEGWRGVGPGEALLAWSAALFADGATGWASPLALAVAIAGSALGAWKLRRHGPIVWLMVGLVVVPFALATVASGFFHSFRERGFIAVVGAPWVLIASALLAPAADDPKTSVLDAVLRVFLGAGVVLVTSSGLSFHYAERKEDWRAAASAVSHFAAPDDPIFFVHFAAEVPFDRYFPGPQLRIGVPDTFDWADGYHARYLVTLDDVARRVPPALAGAQQAWAILSHDGGRGSEYLVAALDRWGTRVSEERLVGVRVLRYQRRSFDLPGSGG